MAHENFLGVSSGDGSVQVCLICLDTDSKMTLLCELNLTEAYEKLTGYPLCDRGNLKQTLCVQCAQTLRKFSRFRDKSLIARSLMMKLIEKHKLITVQNIQMLKYGNNQLKNDSVSTTLRPDHCDLNILEHSDEDRQTGLEETVHGAAVKTECSEDSPSFNEDAEVIKCGFQCTVCYEEFHHEHAYSAHVSMHMHDDVQPPAHFSLTIVTPLSARLAANTGNDEANTKQNGERALVINSGATNVNIKGCVVKLYDIFKFPQNAFVKVESSTQILKDVSSCDTLNAVVACEDAQHHAASVGEVATVSSVPSETEACTSLKTPRKQTHTCDVCQHAFTHKGDLVKHMRIHTGEKPYSCKVCSCKFTRRSHLVVHVRIHTGEKPYSCKTCSYKSRQKGSLVQHMRTHTGEKPFSCKVCSSKFSRNSNLVTHVRSHTGEKPYSCKICCYKSAEKGTLVKHIRTHTGEKPYSCKICSYKSKEKGSLVQHMQTHTGEKPFSCKVCSSKFSRKSNFVKHMQTHTSEKPFSCKVVINFDERAV